MSDQQVRPIVGITADASGDKFSVGRSYAAMAAEAGATPIILPCLVERIPDYLRICDSFMLTGGDDPIVTQWGIAMHPNARPMHPDRQRFELALLDALAAQPRTPVLGICLGMQLMGLHAGGSIDQHLADSLATADQHWDKREHEVEGELGRGIVHSHHRQALTDAGRLRVVSRAPDGVIEAIRDDARPFYVGVQWHPERTRDRTLGIDVIRKLVNAPPASARR